LKGNSCGLTHLILTFHGWLDGWMDGSSCDKRPELTARLVDCMRACVHGPQTPVPRRSKIPRSLGPLGSPPHEPMFFDWPDRHTRPSLTWDRSACQRDASLESPHSVQPSPSHFSASVPQCLTHHASRLTASPTRFLSRDFPSRPLDCRASHTATRQQIASINWTV
jgi:hypothetical protein